MCYWSELPCLKTSDYSGRAKHQCIDHKEPGLNLTLKIFFSVVLSQNSNLSQSARIWLLWSFMNLKKHAANTGWELKLKTTVRWGMSVECFSYKSNFSNYNLADVAGLFYLWKQCIKCFYSWGQILVVKIWYIDGPEWSTSTRRWDRGCTKMFR